MKDDVRVVMVDDSGNASGTVARMVAHQGQGVLHSAISVQVVSDTGRWLIQQRAEQKAVFGGRWANTCCSHPLPGEEPSDAARRRAREELGLELIELELAGTFTYRAVDERTGYVEHEFDQVFVAFVSGEPLVDADPDEIAAVEWADPEQVGVRVGAPDAAPWFKHVAALVSAASI